MLDAFKTVFRHLARSRFAKTALGVAFLGLATTLTGCGPVVQKRFDSHGRQVGQDEVLFPGFDAMAGSGKGKWVDESRARRQELVKADNYVNVIDMGPTVQGVPSFQATITPAIPGEGLKLIHCIASDGSTNSKGPENWTVSIDFERQRANVAFTAEIPDPRTEEMQSYKLLVPLYYNGSNQLLADRATAIVADGPYEGRVDREQTDLINETGRGEPVYSLAIALTQAAIMADQQLTKHNKGFVVTGPMNKVRVPNTVGDYKFTPLGEYAGWNAHGETFVTGYQTESSTIVVGESKHYQAGNNVDQIMASATFLNGKMAMHRVFQSNMKYDLERLTDEDVPHGGPDYLVGAIKNYKLGLMIDMATSSADGFDPERLRYQGKKSFFKAGDFLKAIGIDPRQSRQDIDKALDARLEEAVGLSQSYGQPKAGYSHSPRTQPRPKSDVFIYNGPGN